MTGSDHEGASAAPSENVLLIHSGGFSSRQWRKLADELAPTYRVSSPDLLGYGAEPPWPEGEPFDFRQDLARLASLLDGTLDGMPDGPPAPAHIVGHSYGGLLALHLALARPGSVRSLALFEPVAFGILDPEGDAEALRILALASRDYVPGQGGADETWLRGFVDWWNGDGAWAALGEETKATFRAVGWKLSQEVASLMTDPTDRATYRTISAPTLLLGGARSPLTERRVLEALSTTLPNATLHVLADMGHTGPITHAELVNEMIVAHIRSCAPAAPAT